MNSIGVKLTDNELDLLNTPLKGSNLIEASAGTGKTFAISHLFIRLLLEKEFPSSSVLVVTFTDAATQELKERIYLLLKEALAAFMSNFSDDPFFQELLRRIEHEKAIELLSSALHSFDSISIYTIHGFCQKVLSEHSFESGINFESVIITDQNELVSQITDDFWRINFYSASPVFASYAIQSGINTQNLRNLLKISSRSSQKIRIVPDFQEVNCEAEESTFVEVFNKFRDGWQIHRDDIGQILRSGGITCR